MAVWIAGLLPLRAQLKKGPFYQTSIAAGPVLSFYQLNAKHTSGKKSGAAFTALVRCNFRLNRSASINLGVQYLFHSNHFNSYYFPDSTIQLYDKNFNYTYENRFQDVSFPIGLKLKLINNKQKESCLYTELTWALKKRFASNVQINSSLYGNSVYDNKAGNDFRSRYIADRTGSTIALGFGFDKNFTDKKSGWFIGLTYCYTLNTFYYYRTANMPKNLYQIESFLWLTAGFRF
jgi:hypothetical protein